MQWKPNWNFLLDKKLLFSETQAEERNSKHRLILHGVDGEYPKIVEVV